MDERLGFLSFKQILGAAADFLLPRHCVVCGRSLLQLEDSICLCCLADLPLTHYWSVSRNPMADKYNSKIEAESYQYAAALFFYREGQPHSIITRSLKYNRDFRAGRRFARMLASRLEEAPWFRDVDAVVPVPLHPSRLRSRGYNQAEIIATEVSGRLGASLETDLLRRVRKTRTQTQVSAAEKEANVSGAFRAQRPERAFRHVLLIDDVFTTGSTVSQCQAALREVLGTGVRISVATLATLAE